MIKFFYKKALAADFVQCTVKNLIPCCLHGQNFYLKFRIMVFYVIPDHLALQYRELAFSASDRNLILHYQMPPLPPELPHGLSLLFCDSVRLL